MLMLSANFPIVNIGKWVLGNLFAPFVARQKMIQSEPDYFPDLSQSDTLQLPPGLSRSSISRQGGPRHIHLEARKIRSIAEISASHHTPGLAATPTSIPMTPALLPDLPPDALSKGAAATMSTSFENKGGDKEGAGTALATPSAAGTTPRTARRSQTLDETSSGTHNADYFSVRRRSSLGRDERLDGTKAASSTAHGGSESAADGETAMASNSIPVPSTPAAGVATSGSHASSTTFGIMGKLRALGKQKKLGVSDSTEVATAPITPAIADTDKVLL